jgi:hypothetical protein
MLWPSLLLEQSYFLAVDRYEDDAVVANLLKFLLLIFTSVAILHRLRPFGIAWF